MKKVFVLMLLSGSIYAQAGMSYSQYEGIIKAANFFHELFKSDITENHYVSSNGLIKAMTQCKGNDCTIVISDFTSCPYLVKKFVSSYALVENAKDITTYKGDYKLDAPFVLVDFLLVAFDLKGQIHIKIDSGEYILTKE